MLEIMGRTRGPGSTRDFHEGTQGETTGSKVSLRYVDVPDAELRLDQALELLLAGTLSADKLVEGHDLQGDPNGENSTADRDVT